MIPYFYEISIKPYFKVTTIPDYYDGSVLIMFMCAKNTSKIILHMNPKISGIKYYYPDHLVGRKLAGYKILSLFKMLKAKKYVKNISSLLNKVKKIQSFWRRALFIKHHR